MRSRTTGIPGAFLHRTGLGYPHPFHRQGLIARLSQLLFQVEQTAGAVFGEARHRDVVHAAATCVGLHLFPCQFQRPVCVHVVDQTKPLVSFHPSHEGRLHAFRPHLRFGSRHPYRGGASLSRLFIPSGNYRGFCFLGVSITRSPPGSLRSPAFPASPLLWTL